MVCNHGNLHPVKPKKECHSNWGSLCKAASTINAIIHYQWKSIWLIPCALAGVVMIIFALTFKEKLPYKKSV
jgi:hypothetical protein